MRVKGKFTGLALSARFGREPFKSLSKMVNMHGERGKSPSGLSPWGIAGWRYLLIISPALLPLPSEGAAEQQSWNMNIRKTRRTRGTAEESQYRAYLNVSCLEELCSKAVSRDLVWDTPGTEGGRWLSKAGAVGYACKRKMLRREKKVLAENCICQLVVSNWLEKLCGSWTGKAVIVVGGRSDPC